MDYSERSKRQREKNLAYIKSKLEGFHPNEIDCSDLINNYVGDKVKYKFICPDHGEFEEYFDRVIPGPRARKYPCPACSVIKKKLDSEMKKKRRQERRKVIEEKFKLKYGNFNKKKITLEEYMNRIKEIWGDRYDYTRLNYRGQDEQVLVTCKEHGDFSVNARSLMRGRGCPLCARIEAAKNTLRPLEEVDQMIKEKYGTTVRLHRTTYKGLSKPAKFTCPVHGVFEEKPSLVLLNGCTLCSKEERGMGFSEFVKKANRVHNRRYTYSMEGYRNTISPVKIRCSYHGWFYQNGQEHLRGAGCKKCKSSHGEKLVRSWLNGLGIVFQEEAMIYPTQKRFDFLIPSDPYLVIEWDGEQHFVKSDFMSDPTESDADKNEIVNNSGGKILRLSCFDSETDNYRKLIDFLLENNLKFYLFTSKQSFEEYNRRYSSNEALYTGDGIVEPI